MDSKVEGLVVQKPSRVSIQECTILQKLPSGVLLLALVEGATPPRPHQAAQQNPAAGVQRERGEGGPVGRVVQRLCFEIPADWYYIVTERMECLLLKHQFDPETENTRALANRGRMKPQVKRRNLDRSLRVCRYVTQSA